MKIVILYYYLTTKLLNVFCFRFLSKIVLHFRFIMAKQKIIKKSKFYHQYKKKSFYDFPIMSKQIMMENFNTINTCSLSKDEVIKIALKAETDKSILPEQNGITIGLSSGTSGNRGIFIASKLERAKWVGVILAKLLPFSILRKQSICLYLRNNSKLYESITSKTLSFTYFSLDQKLNNSLEKLNKLNPNIIVAPSSVLKKIAKAQSSGIISIVPKKIISAAEVLTIQDKKFIEKIFKQTLHQIYQCTEGFLASSCKYGNLHLNEDFIKFEKEWIDNNKTRFSPIITDCLRTSQPIFRYKLNDILIPSKDACQCGSTHLLIKEIVGRCDDIFKFIDTTNKNFEIFPDYLRRAIMTSSDTIEEYYIEQTSHTELLLAIKSDNENDFNNAKNAILTLVKKYGKTNLLIKKIKYKTPNIENKLRRVKSNIRNNFDELKNIVHLEV